MSELEILALVLPVVALIAIGWLVVRLGVLRSADAKPLTTAFLYVFLPALLIEHLSTENIRALFNFRFITATAFLMLAIYGAVLLIHRVLLKRRLDASALAAFAASKFNAVVIGLPLLVAALGRGAMTPVIINLVLGYFTILPVTLILLELARTKQGEGSVTVGRSVVRAMQHTARDPLVVATVIGLGVAISGLTLPGWMQTTFSTLGAAAVPVPLVAAGMAMQASASGKTNREIIWMSAARAIGGPLAAIAVAKVFALPADLAIAFVISFSLPTAKMAFALAEDQGVYVETMAGIVTLTTSATVITYPAVVWVCERLWPGVIGSHRG